MRRQRASAQAVLVSAAMQLGGEASAAANV
jgi:hypothetical protein